MSFSFKAKAKSSPAPRGVNSWKSRASGQPLELKAKKRKKMRKHAYDAGSAQALNMLGLNKVANLAGLAAPALGGAALGAGAGAISSPEGRRMEGAALGAGLGAAGGAGGAALGSALGRSGIRKATDKLIAAKGAPAEARQALTKELASVVNSQPSKELGGAMLGATTGSGLGMAMTPNEPQLSPELDPYQYAEMMQQMPQQR